MNVSIVQLCLPHYRTPFFRQLSEVVDGRLAIVSGSYSFGKTPQSVVDPDGLNHILITNKFWGNRLALQLGLPAQVYQDDIIVLEFNPRILSNFWLLARRRKAGKAVILWGHGLSRRAHFPSWVISLRKVMARNASALIFYSEEGRQQFLELGISHDKLFVAPNTLDVSDIQPFVSDNNDYRKNILYIGRLIPEKKVDLLIRAFIQAIPALPQNVNLILIGDGSEKRRLQDVVDASEGQRRVQFVGKVTKEEQLAVHFNSSLLSVSPGYIGLSANHSLAYGVPMLVAADEPHSPEIITVDEDETGSFFESNNVTDLANKLVALTNDRQKTLEMGKRGREKILSHFTLDHMVAGFTEAINYSLVSSGK